MKKTPIIHFFALVTTCSACVISKKTTDNSVIRYVSRHTQQVKEAAAFSILMTVNKTKNDFSANDIEDKKMRKEIMALGSSVEVSYNGSIHEIADSNVTFKSLTLFGVTEVIYDFAATPRHFSDNTKNRRYYYFVKVADRIYYRRRQIPMM